MIRLPRLSIHRPFVARDRLNMLVVRSLVLILAVGLITAGILLVSRRGAANQAVRVNPDDIAPALALRTLAGEADTLVLDEALEENKLETAFATLYYSTSLTDQERATYYITLGQKFAEAREKTRASFCYGQASSILLLSSAPFDGAKASAHLTLGKDLAVIGDRAEAERNLDFAYTIARYSPNVEEPQRRFILSNLATEYKSLGQDRKADESTRAQSSLPAGYGAAASPANVDLPPSPLGDEVKAATAWRVRAVQRLINSLGSKSASAIDNSRRNLEDALRAEDDLRSLVLENRLGQAPSADVKAALAKSRADWLVLRSRIAQKGFGLSLVPAWERSAAQIRTNLRQALSNYYLLRREMAVSLPDPIDASQARLDLLREEMMLGKIALYPDYPENRLIGEMAQATKERIDLREDGLYVAVLSQEGRGLLVITTADLWGRPAAMASAGLGMSFPTMRSPVFAYAPTPVPTRTPTAGRSTPVVASPTAAPPVPPQQTVSSSPTVPPQPTLPMQPTQPTSPIALATAPTGVVPFPTPPLVASPTPVLPPTLVPIPTATLVPIPTPTPAYNYQVLYQSGPSVRDSSPNDNFHIVGMVVDQSGVLIPGVPQRLAWCCPAGQAVHPRPTIDVDNGRFDFFIGRGQFTLDILDGFGTTEPIVVNTDVPGLTGYVEWEYTLQRTNRGMPSTGATYTPTPTATPTGTITPAPPTPTPPLPGARTAVISLVPGWNFIALPLNPVNLYTGLSLKADINSQINNQGGGVAQVLAWGGSSLQPLNGNVAVGVGYSLQITGTNRVLWQMTGYSLTAPVQLNLNQAQKTSVAFPFTPGAQKSAAQLRDEIDRVFGAGTFIRVYRMEEGTGNWIDYDGTTHPASFPLLSDRGYLIEVSQTVSWSPWQSATPTTTATATPTPTASPTATATPFDTYEPNNSFDQAPLMDIDMPVISYISYALDRDFYKYSMPTSGTIYISLPEPPADYDLYLYNSTRQQIDASYKGGQTSEFITHTVGSGLYYVLVQGAGPVYDAIKPYKVLLSLGP